MSGAPLSPGRVAKWDNVKAFLILIVVFGHGLTPFITDELTRTVTLWLYSFHMPLFVFMGGLFAKRTVNTTPFNYEKVVGYFLLSFFIKCLSYLSITLCGGSASFNLFEENGVAWYIFVMAVHLIIAHTLRNCNRVKVLVVSIILALGVGYIGQIGNTLVMSRIFVYFPVFYLGYMIDRDKLLSFINKTWLRILSLVAFVTFTLGLYFVIDKVYSLRYVFTGNNPYCEFGEDWYPFGAALRLGCYCVSAFLGLCILSFMPNKKIPLVSYCGTKTLQIYALHRACQFVMDYTFLKDLISPLPSKYIILITMGISVALTLILSLKPFEYVLYPCTNWRKFFSLIIKWFKK